MDVKCIDLQLRRNVYFTHHKLRISSPYQTNRNFLNHTTDLTHLRRSYNLMENAIKGKQLYFQQRDIILLKGSIMKITFIYEYHFAIKHLHIVRVLTTLLPYHVKKKKEKKQLLLL